MPFGPQDHVIIERKIISDKHVNLLREACNCLRIAPTGLITKISITCNLANAAEDERAISGLIERLAEEYELLVQVQFFGRAVTTCFYRREGMNGRRTGE